jgi:hypothetical protein
MDHAPLEDSEWSDVLFAEAFARAGAVEEERLL